MLENNGIPGQGNSIRQVPEVGESRMRVLGKLNYKAEWIIMVGSETRDLISSRP